MSYTKRLGENWTPSMVWQSGIYSKEICGYFDSEDEMYNWEIDNVTQKEVNDKLCYNIIPGGYGGWYGCNTEEVHKKAGETQKGKKLSEETRRKISKAKKGKPHTEEFKRKVSESLKGRQFSEETRRKMSEAKKGNKNGLGYHWSEERKRKSSEAQKGKSQLKFQWLDSDGNIHIMDKANAMRYHPNWILVE